MQPVQNCNHSDMQFEETLGNAQWVNQFFLNSQEFLENSREISLLALDLEAFSFHFSLSISISRHFHFTFHSRSRIQGICFSLFILEMSESDFHFTFHFSNKKWKRIFFTFTSRTFNFHSRRTLLCNVYLEKTKLILYPGLVLALHTRSKTKLFRDPVVNWTNIGNSPAQLQLVGSMTSNLVFK